MAQKQSIKWFNLGTNANQILTLFQQANSETMANIKPDDSKCQ